MWQYSKNTNNSHTTDAQFGLLGIDNVEFSRFENNLITYLFLFTNDENITRKTKISTKKIKKPNVKNKKFTISSL